MARHRVRDLFGEARDLADLDARRELELVARHGRADGRVDQARVDAELAHRRLEHVAALLDHAGVDLALLALLEQAGRGQLPVDLGDGPDRGRASSLVFLFFLVFLFAFFAFFFFVFLVLVVLLEVLFGVLAVFFVLFFLVFLFFFLVLFVVFFFVLVFLVVLVFFFQFLFASSSSSAATRSIIGSVVELVEQHRAAAGRRRRRRPSSVSPSARSDGNVN